LGLRTDPFSTEPDSLFYYSYDSFEQRLKVLQGLVQGTDLFVLIIGEPGSGKTTLLNRYLASVDREWESARIHTEPETASTQSSKMHEPGGYPAYILQDSANPIVIVDDAHRLAQQELEFIIQQARVPGSTNRIKRLVLFGESSLYTLVTKIAASLSTQPAVNKIYLPGLTEEQTADYLQHRLATAGYSGEFLLNLAEIKKIHQTSGGYPGPINKIAHQWLTEKLLNKKDGQNMLQTLSAIPRSMMVWLAAGIIIILLAAFWLFSDRDHPRPNAPDQKLTKTVFRKKIVPDRKLSDNTVTKKIVAAQTPVNPPAAFKTQQTPDAETPTPLSEPVNTQQPVRQKTVGPETTITAPLKNDSQPKSGLQQEVKPAQRTPAPVIAKTAVHDVHREKWLLAQDSASYTIQIVGVSNETSLLDYIKRNQRLNQNEMAYYESTFKGKPWYQLLYGIYPNRQEAQLAADNLPENIRRAEPWIRKISAVQKAIQDRDGSDREGN